MSTDLIKGDECRIGNSTKGAFMAKAEPSQKNSRQSIASLRGKKQEKETTFQNTLNALVTCFTSYQSNAFPSSATNGPGYGERCWIRSSAELQLAPLTAVGTGKRGRECVLESCHYRGAIIKDWFGSHAETRMQRLPFCWNTNV